MSDIQHKKPFNLTADFYEPVEPSHPVKVLQSLAEAGAVFPDPSRAAEILENELEKAADDRAVENMVRLFAALKNSQNAAALAYLVERDQKSLRAVAAKVGCSHVALWKRLQRLLAYLGGG